jgi:hypothetical protein
MKHALISAFALLTLSSIPTSAITVVEGLAGYDFGTVPVGETREIAFYLLSSPAVSQEDLLICNSVPGLVRCERRETESLYDLFDNDSPFTGFNADCGKPGLCLGVRLTSRASDVGIFVDGLVQYTSYYDYVGVFADGSERKFGGNSFDFTNAVSYTATTATVSPVPVPAALPLLATGLAALGVLRKRRQK